MKRIIKLSAAFLLLVFVSTSCSSDDNNNNNPNTEPSIVGKWNWSKQGGIYMGQEILLDYQHQAGCSKDYIKLNSNGTSEAKKYTSVNNPCEETVETAMWVKTGNNVHMTLNGMPYTVEIVSLTATTLKVKYTQSSSVIVLFEFTKA